MQRRTSESAVLSELYHVLKGVVFSLPRSGSPSTLASPVEALNSVSVTSRCSAGTKFIFEKTRFFIASMFLAEWTSRSSEYLHSQTYIRSSRFMLCFFPHFGHHLVVGIHLSSMMIWGSNLSFALINPKHECYICLPNLPLCHPAICSSCMTIQSYAFSLWTSLFAMSCFLFESFWYSRRISLIVLRLLFEPLTRLKSFLCSFLSRSLSSTDTSSFSPSDVVMFVLIPKSRPISFPLVFCSLKFSLLMKHVTFR